MTALRKFEGVIERWADALTDPARRDRAMLILLGAYTIAWTIYGTLAKASQDLHADMTEIVDWSRELALGYHKHPPLAPYLTRAWFAIFPDYDWAFYLLAILVAALSLWISWRAALRLLDPRKALAATLLLTLIPFFNFHALKFNANTVLMPVWAATILWFMISYETRSRLYAVLAGAGAAAAMLGKYWSIFLLLGLGIAALLDPRRGAYFRSSAPYLTALTGGLLVAPHVAWIAANDFAPFRYATGIHSGKSFGTAALSALGYLGGSLAYAAASAIIAVLLFRMSGAAIRDTLMPPAGERRWIVSLFLFPLLLPALLAPLGGTTVNSLWSTSAWTLFGVVLLASPLVTVTRQALASLLGLSIAIPLVMIPAAPLIAYAVHPNGFQPWQAHTSLLAPEVDKLWRETTPQPLMHVCGDAGLAFGVAFYSDARPLICDDLQGFAAGNMQRDGRMVKDGFALMCFDNAACSAEIGRLSAGIPGSKRRTIELSRSLMGVQGPRERYLIGTVPPQK